MWRATVASTGAKITVDGPPVPRVRLSCDRAATGNFRHECPGMERGRRACAVCTTAGRRARYAPGLKGGGPARGWQQLPHESARRRHGHSGGFSSNCGTMVELAFPRGVMAGRDSTGGGVGRPGSVEDKSDGLQYAPSNVH